MEVSYEPDHKRFEVDFRDSGNGRGLESGVMLVHRASDQGDVSARVTLARNVEVELRILVKLSRARRLAI